MTSSAGRTPTSASAWGGGTRPLLREVRVHLPEDGVDALHPRAGFLALLVREVLSDAPDEVSDEPAAVAGLCGRQERHALRGDHADPAGDPVLRDDADALARGARADLQHLHLRARLQPHDLWALEALALAHDRPDDLALLPYAVRRVRGRRGHRLLKLLQQVAHPALAQGAVERLPEDGPGEAVLGLEEPLLGLGVRLAGRLALLGPGGARALLGWGSLPGGGGEDSSGSALGACSCGLASAARALEALAWAGAWAGAWAAAREEKPPRCLLAGAGPGVSLAASAGGAWAAAGARACAPAASPEGCPAALSLVSSLSSRATSALRESTSSEGRRFAALSPLSSSWSPAASFRSSRTSRSCSAMSCFWTPARASSTNWLKDAGMGYSRRSMPSLAQYG
eukprot:CAMPEP_0175523218 /NCGR_PEP_ID=MMETSP0096-20121207/17950_1 /TAXON_ID=311494 /ORGANISM="Alexandrium monilatum, Strain CCMP3105" /LENGTH=397 /DNA_ID=CAMNT_0016825737 /DNA_START=140 /DNA_END=1332 /DNA_ORIENTATION=+